jgi:hypothetical protein
MPSVPVYGSILTVTVPLGHHTVGSPYRWVTVPLGHRTVGGSEHRRWRPCCTTAVTVLGRARYGRCRPLILSTDWRGSARYSDLYHNNIYLIIFFFCNLNTLFAMIIELVVDKDEHGTRLILECEGAWCWSGGKGAGPLLTMSMFGPQCILFNLFCILYFGEVTPVLRYFSR